MTDAHWAALSPFLTYWIVSGFYEFIDTFNLFSQYRIRPSDEECKRNLAKKSAVLKHVLLMLAIQSAMGLVVAEMLPPLPHHDRQFGTLSYFHSFSTDLWTSWKLDQDTLGFVATFLLAGPWLMRICYLAARQFLALVILDTWVFWGHYLEHQNPWLYRNIHSVHHQLYTPFSYGALYNHWAESLCVDQMGGLLGATVVGLSEREAIFFYAAVTAKTVEDHCAYDLPWSPFSLFARLTGAGIVYHNVHHQSWGLKTNFQIYFTWWDRWMNSVYNGPHTLYAPPAQAKGAGTLPKLDTKESVHASGRDSLARRRI